MTMQPTVPPDVPIAAEPAAEHRRLGLADSGVRLFACRLLNHDYLWFSGTEFSKRSETLPILHNYALTYSLGDFSYWQGPRTPQYEEDMACIQVYATPADGPQASRTQVTYNALDDLTLRTDNKGDQSWVRGRNTPDLGYRSYIDPVFAAADLRHPAGFLAYLFTFDDRSPKGVTRLGKKGTAWRVVSAEIKNPVAVWQPGVLEPSHPVNPLDVSGVIVAYEPVVMPPHLLCRRAQVRADWFVRSQDSSGVWHTVHVPCRVLTRVGITHD